MAKRWGVAARDRRARSSALEMRSRCARDALKVRVGRVGCVGRVGQHGHEQGAAHSSWCYPAARSATRQWPAHSNTLTNAACGLPPLLAPHCLHPRPRTHPRTHPRWRRRQSLVMVLVHGRRQRQRPLHRHLPRRARRRRPLPTQGGWARRGSTRAPPPPPPTLTPTTVG